MNFNIVDTQQLYSRLLAEPDAALREKIMREEMLAPFSGVFQVFSGADPLQQLTQWHMIGPGDFANEHRDSVRNLLDQLAGVDAWDKTRQTLADVQRVFAPYADRIPLEAVAFGLFLADFSQTKSADRGYTGFGGLPGWVMVIYGEVNDYTSARIQGATAHEMLHNLHFSVQPFNPMTVTVGEYIIAEGLAESFAAELYGEDVLGYYVTDFDTAQLELSRQIIGEGLHRTGFDVVRGYIFGDSIAEQWGFPKPGIPDFAGYAIGYRIVQQYLKKTGKSVAETIFVPAHDIIAESGYFAG